ncbi:MAG: substrate-binding domain-containing protein [Clostridiales bacterium]|nr:substrate-binding domain-containing protein [Clostridiales bacterium]
MKRRIMSIVLISAMVLSAGCKKKNIEESSTETTTETTESSVVETTTEPTPVETSSTDPEPAVYNFKNVRYPVIDGSTSTKPMATAITSVLLGVSRSEADQMLQFHKTSASFGYLMDREADILIVAEPAQSVFDEMKNRNFQYEMEPFSAEALVFVVNTSNPVESLTTEQIQKIYTGEIKNWKEVGGEDKEIVAVQRNKTAGSQVMMENLVMGDLQMMDAPEELMPEDMGGLINVVKSYDNSAGAIGYTPYYYAKNMKMADGLKILKVNDVMPDTETIGKGEYAFRTAYYVVIPESTGTNAPARILFNWILSEEGQKLAEMEGYVPASSDPKDRNSTEVQLDWSAYQPASAGDPVFTRIKDEEITDFIPSSDYGRVFPFAGVVKTGEYEDSHFSMYGFFDIHGRIVCDAVFDSYQPFDSKAYLVTQYDETVKERYKSTLRYGVISADGSKFTGMKFDNVCREGDDGILLVENVKDGINVYPYDLSTGTLGSPKLYKVDHSKIDYFSSLFVSKIIKDRYVVFDGDEGMSAEYVIDGQTGKRMTFPTGYHVREVYGNLFSGYTDLEPEGVKFFFDVNGNKVLDGQYCEARYLGKDRILLSRIDRKGWDLTDADGKVLASVENTNSDINEFYEHYGFFIAKKNDCIELYDMDMKLINSVKDDFAFDFYGAGVEEIYYSEHFASESKSTLIMYRTGNSGKTSLIDMNTGKRTEIDGEYSATVFNGYILLSSSYDPDGIPTWKLLSSSDFQIVCEGKGTAEAFEDLKGHKYYLEIKEDYRSKTLSIVDVESGKTMYEDLPNPRGDCLYLEYIYDKCLVYTTSSLTDYHLTSTNMIDKDGKVTFLYNPVFIPED